MHKPPPLPIAAAAPPPIAPSPDELFKTLPMCTTTSTAATPPPPPCTDTLSSLASTAYFTAPPEDMTASGDDALVPEEIVVLNDAAADAAGAPCGHETADADLLSASVRGLIEGLHLGDARTADALRAASGFIAEQGYDSAAELNEVGAADELIAHLDLKPGKARLLSKRLAEHDRPTTPLAVPVGEPVVQLAALPMGSIPMDWRTLALAYTRAEGKLEHDHEARSRASLDPSKSRAG